MKQLIHNILDFASWIVAQLYAPSLNIKPDKTDYPEKTEKEVFSNKADEVISKPSRIDRLADAHKKETADKEFWETLQ